MKTLTQISAQILLGIFFISAIAFTGCDNSNPLTPDTEVSSGDGDSRPRVELKIEKVGGGYKFTVTNKLDAMINDFHIQFRGSVKIINQSLGAGWTIHNPTTNPDNGKIGIQTTTACINPGQSQTILFLQLRFTADDYRNPFLDWQATRNGVVVYNEETAALPNE